MKISISKFFNVFLKVVVLLGVFHFLFVLASHGNGERKTIAGVKFLAARNMKHRYRYHVEVMMRRGREKLRSSSKSHINYMSKRRVPNGPDPIHNRKAGNSRQPPGQA